MADFLCRNFTVLVLESCVTFLSISLYIHAAVLVQMILIVLLAKTMFYVSW